jgi:hypothetical protein
MIALLSGCGPSKKVLKTDITTTTHTSAVKVDTSVVKVAWEDVLNTVVNQIDLSTIKITTYYPTIDSVTGKQPVKSDIVIDKNVKTDLKAEQKAAGTEVKKAGISEETKQNSQIREIVQVKEKKTGIPIKYYLIGFAVLAGIGYLAYKFIRHQFF